MVETCSKTAADCPCLVFPYIERTGQGLRPAVGGLFSFRQYDAGTGLCCPLAAAFSLSAKDTFQRPPATRWTGIFQISFALVIRATGFWQPAGQRIFPFTPHTTALRNLPNGAGSFFWLHLPTTGDFRFCQMDTKKAANLFQTYCFRWPLVGG